MKINHYLVKGEVKRIQPYVYCVAIKDHYDRGMLFARYQEFYESPIKGIRNKYFSLEGLMKKYKDHYKKDTFTYPDDFAGYNIPSDSLYSAMELFFNQNRSVTEYDDIMFNIVSFCEKDIQKYDRSPKYRYDFYLIGTDNFESKLMDHEMAHALYYTNPDYRANCNELILGIKKHHYERLSKILVKIGYVNKKTIINDEIQAYMSTGLYDDLKLSAFKKYQKYFIRNFKLFINAKRN